MSKVQLEKRNKKESVCMHVMFIFLQISNICDVKSPAWKSLLMHSRAKSQGRELGHPVLGSLCLTALGGGEVSGEKRYAKDKHTHANARTHICTNTHPHISNHTCTRCGNQRAVTRYTNTSQLHTQSRHRSSKGSFRYVGIEYLD